MAVGGPPRENVGPTQGWRGGPPSAPGSATHTDAGLPDEQTEARREGVSPKKAREEMEQAQKPRK